VTWPFHSLPHHPSLTALTRSAPCPATAVELSVASCSARAWKLIPSDFPNHLVVTHSNMVCVPLRIRRFLTSSLHWRTCRRCSIDPALFLLCPSFLPFPRFPPVTPDMRAPSPYPLPPLFRAWYLVWPPSSGSLKCSLHPSFPLHFLVAEAFFLSNSTLVIAPSECMRIHPGPSPLTNRLPPLLHQ
jgi:hypothetical protein